MNRLAGPGGASVTVRYAIIELAKLHSHEEVQPPLLKKLVDQIRADGYIRRPVLVDAEHFVVLDGHHRVEALRILGCTRIPAYLVDYDDPAIGLTTWPEAKVKTVSKKEVIERGLRGQLYPPKTTRHLVSLTLDEVRVSIADLR